MNLITYDQKSQCFHLKNNQISYIMEIEEEGILAQIYFGKKIASYNGGRKYPRLDRSFSPNFSNATDRLLSLDTLLQEYPGYGSGDFREPAHIIKHHDGSTVTDFRYESFRIEKGKPVLKDLPATYVKNDLEAETLFIIMKDHVTQLSLELQYTIFKDYPAITRSVKLINASKNSISIKKLVSMSFAHHAIPFDLIHLNGSWARERMFNSWEISTFRAPNIS